MVYLQAARETRSLFTGCAFVVFALYPISNCYDDNKDSPAPSHLGRRYAAQQAQRRLVFLFDSDGFCSAQSTEYVL